MLYRLEIRWQDGELCEEQFTTEAEARGRMQEEPGLYGTLYDPDGTAVGGYSREE